MGFIDSKNQTLPLCNHLFVGKNQAYPFITVYLTLHDKKNYHNGLTFKLSEERHGKKSKKKCLGP